ncbi:retrotransposon Gag-like protein 3 [Natator depressus]|uniref:retrotransposon Gag-like protein 3 n=1 Tax=Natator depressus TaxID=27790 RepID=UPI003EB7244F
MCSTSEVPAVPSPLVPSGTTAQGLGPKIPLSEKSDGNRQTFRGVAQCHLLFLWAHQSYATHFHHLVSDTAWNEAAQISHFYLGLNDEIKDELARVDTPTALLPYIKMCIQIDDRLSDARKEGRYTLGPCLVLSHSIHTQLLDPNPCR